MVDSVKVKITTVQAETTVGVNKSCTFRIRTTIVVRTKNLCSVLRNISVLQLLIQLLLLSQVSG